MLDLLLDLQQFSSAEYAAMLITCVLNFIAFLSISVDVPAAVVVIAFPASLVGAYISCVVFGDAFDTDLIQGRLESIVVASAIGMTIAVIGVLAAYRYRSDE